MKRRTVLGGVVIGLAAGSFSGALRWSSGAQGQQVSVAAHRLAAMRRQAGLRHLTHQPVLMEMGCRHVVHMADLGCASHHDAEGRDPVRRARKVGYAGRILGEVLAETYDAPSETIDVWLDHAPTHNVLMNPDARDLGLAMAFGRDGRRWWTLVTGTL